MSNLEAAAYAKIYLVVLTNKGEQMFDAAMRFQVPWISGLAEGIWVKEFRQSSRSSWHYDKIAKQR
jgi:hypothetical protein